MKNEDKLNAAKEGYDTCMKLIEKVNVGLKDDVNLSNINGRLGLLLKDFNGIVVGIITGEDKKAEEK